MMWLVAAMLLLQPALDDAQEVRLVATGTGGERVEWHLDGERIAVTSDGEAAIVGMPEGSHRLWAVTNHDGAWSAMARPDSVAGEGAHFVPSWTAHHPARESGFEPIPWVLGAVGLMLCWPRRRPKRP